MRIASCVNADAGIVARLADREYTSQHECESCSPPSLQGSISVLELTGEVELLLLFGVMHLRVQVNLSYFQRLVTKPTSDLH